MSRIFFARRGNFRCPRSEVRRPTPDSRLLEYAIVQLLLTPVCGRLQKRKDNRVWLLFCRRELRLEKCRQKEAMHRRLDGANLTLGAASNYRESGFHRSPFEVRIDFEVAEELLGRGLLILPIKRLQIGAGAQFAPSNRRCIASFWRRFS